MKFGSRLYLATGRALLVSGGTIGSMALHMIGLAIVKLQVFNSIIQFVAVNVMHRLIVLKRSAYMLFHEITVCQSASIKTPISLCSEVSSFPCVVALPVMGGTRTALGAVLSRVMSGDKRGAAVQAGLSYHRTNCITISSECILPIRYVATQTALDAAAGETK